MDLATTSSHPVVSCCSGSEVGVSNSWAVSASGAAMSQAVHASRYVPRWSGVAGAGRSDHRSWRRGMVRWFGTNLPVAQNSDEKKAGGVSRTLTLSGEERELGNVPRVRVRIVDAHPLQR